MKNFENHARKSLTADGLQERYVDRRVVGYDKIDPKNILDSRDISFGLVDTYGQFDLTELCMSVEEGEYQYLTSDCGLDIPSDEFEGVEVDFRGVVLEMARHAGEFICEAVNGDLEDKKRPLELEVISYFSPSEYNFTTDSCEFVVKQNPFDTVEELAEYLENSFGHGDGRSLSDDYVYDMIEFLDNYIYENITGYNIRRNGEYLENISLDELEKIYKK